MNTFTVIDQSINLKKTYRHYAAQDTILDVHTSSTEGGNVPPGTDDHSCFAQGHSAILQNWLHFTSNKIEK